MTETEASWQSTSSITTKWEIKPTLRQDANGDQKGNLRQPYYTPHSPFLSRRYTGMLQTVSW